MISDPLISEITLNRLKNWFIAVKRDLPWRKTQDPYAIWVSEVMLQQTQVAVVIDYYQRWMDKFPTVNHLAAANLDDVIKTWEGLGYYSRARNLHSGAQFVVEHFNSELPGQETDLDKIKGLGPYTIGAILSFAFHQKKPAVDGNVLRVLARFFGLNDDIAKTATHKKFRQMVQSFLPDTESWIVNEALIELGATVCQRKAKCSHCPLSSDCKALAKNQTHLLPIKSKGPAAVRLFRVVTILHHGDTIGIRRGKKGEVMEDLYEFPYLEIDKDTFCDWELKKLIENKYPLKIINYKPFETVKQSFTKYQVELVPYVIQIDQKIDHEEWEWMPKNALIRLPFSSGHRKILHQLFVADSSKKNI